MTTRQTVPNSLPPIHGVGRFEDPVILNASSNTSVDAYHTHGACDIFRRIHTAKTTHRRTADWHDADECHRCATLREQQGLTEHEAVAMTVAGELPRDDSDEVSADE